MRCAQCQMLSAHVIRGKNRDEPRGLGRFFYVGPPLGFLTFHQAHDTHDFETEFSGGSDRLHGGRTRGANVVDDHDSGAFLPEAFDALAGAVLLLRFADEKAVERSRGNGDGHHDGVGPHGEASDRIGVPALGEHFVEKDLTHELCAAGIEGCGTAVDVIIAGAAGREFEISQAKGLVRQ